MVKKGGVARESVRAYRIGKVMVLQWQDKCNVTILFTTGTCNMVRVQMHRGVTKEKPVVVELYNKNMFGVDNMHQVAEYYSFLHKSVKW